MDNLIPKSGEGQSTRVVEGLEAVFFDLFDTLVELDEERLPAIPFRGKEARTTAPLVHAELRDSCPDLDADSFLQTYARVTRDFWGEKEDEHVELSAPVRMSRVLEALEIEDPTGELALRLARVHMDGIARAVRLIPGAHEALRRVERLGLPCILISNFDFAPTAHALIEREGLAPFFHHRVISDELGLRKPHRRLFEEALRQAGTTARAALHVGDDPRCDAWGAGRLGIRTVWIDRQGADYPESEFAPTYRARSVRELCELLP